MALKVSQNQRFLTHDDGRPFFWLGDTAWELFHRLDREAADFYLRTRAGQGFTVIQSVVLAEHEFERPGPSGHLPLKNNDPTQPVDEYFAHVDWIVARAAELGLYVGMLPTWGDKWNRKWGGGPEIFNPDNARVFGEYLGRRYRNLPVVWILGGDRPVESDLHRQTITSMAEGLALGDGGTHLKTFHPQGQQSSAEYFHEASWLDFNMFQTGHSRDRDCWRSVEWMYRLEPPKPCLDAEPGYEDHPNGFKPEDGYLDETDVRKSAYWNVFAGAFGHTYGCHDIWQFLQEGWRPITSPLTPWTQAIHFPGAQQMRHLRSLIESRPFLDRIPDQSLLVGGAGEAPRHRQATRAADGSFAFVYVPDGGAVTVDLRLLSGDTARVFWYSPRTGNAILEGEVKSGVERAFSPPATNEERALNDWVLVLDDAARSFPTPGRAHH